MNIRHLRRPGTLEKHDRPVWTSRKGRRLREEASIYEGGCEIRVGLPFDDDSALDEVVPDGQALHSDIEFGASPREVEQPRIPL